MLNRLVATKKQVRTPKAKEFNTDRPISGGSLADLPPPPPSVNPDYIQCPHCGRNYAPNVAERHIPKCVNIQAKPKPPPGLNRMPTQQPRGGASVNTRTSGASGRSNAAYPPPNRSTRGGRF